MWGLGGHLWQAILPMCRPGYFHVVNNDYTHWEMYAIGGSAEPTINSQGNGYLAPANPFVKEKSKSEWKLQNYERKIKCEEGPEVCSLRREKHQCNVRAQKDYSKERIQTTKTSIEYSERDWTILCSSEEAMSFYISREEDPP
ncbi:hypothetical protein LguiB_001999 [Lonicera macranthoides]